MYQLNGQETLAKPIIVYEFVLIGALVMQKALHNDLQCGVQTLSGNRVGGRNCDSSITRGCSA